jgi:hypothetical protein
VRAHGQVFGWIAHRAAVRRGSVSGCPALATDQPRGHCLGRHRPLYSRSWVGHRFAIGWQKEDGQHHSSALVEPAEALSARQLFLAAVGAALGHGSTGRAMADLLSGMDLDADMANLLGGES